MTAKDRLAVWAGEICNRQDKTSEMWFAGAFCNTVAKRQLTSSYLSFFLEQSNSFLIEVCVTSCSGVLLKFVKTFRFLLKVKVTDHEGPEREGETYSSILSLVLALDGVGD